jgi:hypothetical protein
MPSYHSRKCVFLFYYRAVSTKIYFMIADTADMALSVKTARDNANRFWGECAFGTSHFQGERE